MNHTAEDEREAIVAWLRAKADHMRHCITRSPESKLCEAAADIEMLANSWADKIERCTHHKEEADR